MGVTNLARHLGCCLRLRKLHIAEPMTTVSMNTAKLVIKSGCHLRSAHIGAIPPHGIGGVPAALPETRSHSGERLDQVEEKGQVRGSRQKTKQKR